MLAILNKISKSLGVELTKFLQRFGKGEFGSKQAFSQARYKIRWEAFVDLNDTFVQAYYSSGGYQLYRGQYLLLSTDGSDYELPWEEELVAEFGVADNTQNKQPMCMAKGVKIWDILNKLTLSSSLGRYDSGEMHHFKLAWQKATQQLSTCNSAPVLLLADMYYPSFYLMYQLVNQGHEFLFRCPPTFCREVIQFLTTNALEAIICIPIRKDKGRARAFKRQTQGEIEIPAAMHVRVPKFIRPNGELSCLLTSILPEHLNYAAICELYPYRWGEEVSFNFDKYRSEIENFSAKMPQGIRQDWYANTLLTNLAQLLIEDAQELLDQEQKAKSNQYQYQINRSVALGIIKDELPTMLFGKQTPAKFYQRMIKLLLRHRQPIRPNRSFPREKNTG